jgi:hypothetical protein
VTARNVISATLNRGVPERGPNWLLRQSLPSQALICGSAPSLLEEFERARRAIPDAAIITVNESASVVYGNFLITQHPEKALWFRERSENPDVVVHTAKEKERASQPAIDVYWPDCVTLATSGGSAIAIALSMGFTRIVLCGMPMNGGDGYFEGASFRRDEPRFGMESPESRYIRNYQHNLIEFTRRRPETLDCVRSMSGFTKRLFGAPEWSQ